MESQAEKRLQELEKLMDIQAEQINELEAMLAPVLLSEEPCKQTQGEALQSITSTPLNLWLDNSINKIDNNITLIVSLKSRIQL